MSDWSISKRINVLSGCLIGALLVVTALGVGAVMRLAGSAESLKAVAQDMLMIVHIQEDALEARVHELGYRASLADGEAALVLSNIDEIMAIGPEIASFVARDPAGRAALSDVLTEMGDYRRFFEETLALQAESDALVAEVEAREHDLGRVFDAMMSSARASGAFDALLAVGDAKDGMLSALNAFENFLVDNDPDHFVAMEQEIKTARATLDRLAAGPPGPITLGAAEAREGLGAYAAAAMGAREAILSRNGTRAAIDGLGRDLLERLDAVLNHEVARQEAITARNRSILRTTIVLLGVISLAAVAASAAFALSSARRVRAAIEMSVSEMQELAGGNLAVEITGADKDHELGRMAQALVVFRDAAQAARALEAQQAEQERAARLREEEQARRQAAAEEESRRQAAEARAKMIAELRDGLGTVVDGAATGDFSRRITARFAEEEFNRMADGVNRLMSNVEAGVREVARVMSTVAAGDLTERMTGSYAGLFGELQASVNESLATLSRVVDDIASGCGSVTAQAAQMTEQSVELARRAEQQAASLEETSAAMEEISATARSSAEGAAGANDFATRAMSRVDEAGRVVASAVGAMGDIRAASTRIGEIVSVIEGIAFQTNLLALNASVEAARAGTAGKGFAVVATEVRALAQRSSEASQDIKALIDESATQVIRGVDLVEETGVTLKEIVEGVRQMAGALGELVTAGKEQSAGVQEVTAAISQLDVITQKNAALADRSRDMASDLKSRAEAMEALVGTFRTGSNRSRTIPPSRKDAASFDDDWQAA